MKVFEFNPGRRGSYIDPISGAVGVNTNGVWAKTEKGLAWRGDGSGYVDYTSINFGTVFSIVIWFKQKDFRTLFVSDQGAANYLYTPANNELRFRVNSVNSSGLDFSGAPFSDNQWHQLILIRDGGDLTAYMDGVLEDTTTTSETATDFVVRYISNTPSLIYKGDLGKVIGYNHILTPKERAKLYSEFLHAGPVSRKVTDNLDYPKPTDLSNVPGLVAAYNYIEGGNNTDISGNGNNDTTTGKAPLTKSGKYYHGDGKSVIGNIGNIKSVAFRIKLNSTTEKILEGAANDKLIHAASGTLTYSDFDNAFINGVDSNTLVADQWQNIVIISSTDVDFSACTLALNNTTYGNFEIDGLQFFTDQKDLQWSKDYHNSFAKEIHTKDSFDDLGVGSSIG